jgi:hypothetical protein
MFRTDDIAATRGVTAMKMPWQRVGHIFTIGAALLLSTSFSHAQTILLDQGAGTQISTYPVPYPWGDVGNGPTATVSLFGGALLSVDSNGKRTVVSDFGNPKQGPISSGHLNAVSWVPSGLLGSDRTLLALDPFGGTNQDGALFAVDPSTGQRRILSDFGNPKQGLPLGVTPRGIVASPGLFGLDTAIYVVDNNAGTGGHGLLTKIDPKTGNRSVLSDFGNSAQGQLGNNPASIAIAPPGMFGESPMLVVLDTSSGTSRAGVLFLVDLSGNRTAFSDLGSLDQGPVRGVAPQRVAVFPGGQGQAAAIYVTDNSVGNGWASSGGFSSGGGLFRIDPSSGNRTLLSAFDNPAKGPGDDPTEIMATESGDVLVSDDFIDDVGAQNPTPDLLLVNHINGKRTVLSNCSDTALGPCLRPAGFTQLP